MGTDQEKTRQELLDELRAERSRSARLQAAFLAQEQTFLQTGFSDLFDAIDSPVSLIGPDHLFQCANKAYEKYLGIDPKELIGRTPAVIVGERVFEHEIRPKLARCLAGESLTSPLWVNYPRMGRRYMDVSYSPWHGRDGSVSGVLHISRDLTDMYHLERESAAIIETAFSGFLVIDRQGRLLSASAPVSDMLGYSRRELLDMHVWDMEALLNRGDVLKRIEGTVRSGHARFESKVVRKDGVVIDVEISATYLDHEGGKLYIFMRDLSPFRNAEKELRDSEARFKALHDASFGGIAIHDKGVILDCNQGLSDITGYGRDELLGMDGLLLIAPESRGEVMGNILAGYEKPYEVHGIRKNGEEYPVRLQARNIPFRGKPVRAVEFRDITEARRARDALEESLARLKAVVENMPVLLDAFGDDGRIVFWNKECERVTGYSCDEVLGDADMIAVLYPDPDYRQDVYRQVRSAKGTFFNLEFDITCKDGSVRTIAWSNVSSRAPIPGWKTWAIGVDITEQKLAQRALKESELKYKSVVENMRDVYFRTDKDGLITLVSPSSAQLFKLDSSDEAIGAQAASFYKYPEDREKARAELERNGFLKDFEALFVDRQGNVFPASISSAFYHDENGDILGTEGVLRDITERKEAEMRLARSESKFRALFDYAGEGIFIGDSESNITEANFAAAKILGYDSPAELIGKNATDIVHPDDQREKSVLSVYEKASAGESIRLERRYRRKDGSSVPVQLTVKVIGDTGLHHVLFSDISERKRLEEALKTKIVALTQPAGEATAISFEALFDLADMQRIQDEFANATGVASLITRPDGAPLTRPSNFRRICRDIIRCTPQGLKNCELSDAVVGEGLAEGPRVQRCLSGGLWDAGTRISVGGEHVANWLIGQVRDENQTEESMRAYARQIGADEEAMVQAFREVPVMSRERFEAISQALHTLANQISVLAYQNMQQGRFIEKIHRAEGNNRLLAKLLNTSDSIAVYKDTSFRYLMVNDEYLRLTGYSSHEDVLGKTDAQLFSGVATEEQIAEYIENDRRALALSRGELITAEERLPGPDGTQRVFLTKKFPIFDEHSAAPIGVATLTSEITELKEVQDHLAREKERAEAASKAKTEFLANMSHEIRTPLSGIIGILQVLQMSELNEEQREFLRLALLSGKRLTTLLSDILDVSAVEAGKLQLTRGPVQTEGLIGSIDCLFGLTAAQKDVALTKKIWPGVPKVVTGDELRLRQILFNLVGNGLKFTKSGHVSLDVCPVPAAPVPCRNLLFIISDTGPGIPDDQFETVFESFGQLSHGYTRTHQGAGLGLPIVKKLVTLMGGTICLESTVGQGSTFYVSIPLSSPVAQTSAPVRDAICDAVGEVGGEVGGAVGGAVVDTTSQASPAAAPIRLLLVEDEPVNALATAHLLRKTGYEVFTADNGRIALESIQQHDVDVVLMDVQMPEMDGIEATQAIREGRAGERRRGLPIVAMTAYAMDGDRETFLDAGMDDYIAKPVAIAQLREIIDRIIRDRAWPPDRRS